MTPQQIETARKVLAERLAANGRTAKRNEMTASRLSKTLGRDKDYIRDFLEGRKQSLGAAEIAAIERTLDLERGELLGEPNVREIRRVPVGQEFDETEATDGPELLEAARRHERRELAPGEVVERDVVGGMGLGGVASQIVADGKILDGVRAVWRLPVDYLRTELRAKEHDVDFIPVDGDSMVPTLLPGDRVMINRNQTAPSPDGLFAIFDGIGVAVKRLEVVKGSNPIRVRIKSDNPQHGTDEVLADDLHVLGRVICKVTRL